MSREIKFRAWDKVKSEMLYSDNFDSEFRFSDGRIIVGLWKDKGVLLQNEVVSIPDAEYVEEPIIMEYIGIKDDGGKPVYEYDIVRFRSHPNKIKHGVVKYSTQNARFHIEYFNDNLERVRNYPSWQSFGSLNYLDVIGNFYENPDLMEEKQQPV